MEISDYNIKELIKDKEKLAENIKRNEDINNNLKEDRIKISLLNVDSIYRNTQPKNINESNTKFLPKDPITTKKGSNMLKFHYPNHNLNVGDFITITNVESINKTILNSFFLFNSFNYLIIKINHSVPKDYKLCIDNLEIDIKLLTELDSNVDADTKFYGSIPINMLIGLKKVNTYQDILDENLNMTTNILEKLKTSIAGEIDSNLQYDYIYDNFLFAKLDFNFISNSNLDLYKINHVYNISFTSINGIPLNFINADYPINYDKKQGKHEVSNIENDYIHIYTKSKAYSTGELGGSKISLFKILKTISGFPNAGEFALNLRNNFTNVVRIELVSSEFTFTDYVIKEGINNKLYWQHLDDGDKVYEISIPSGNYSATNLIETISTQLNSIERITSTPENRIYNKFEIILNTFTNRLDIKAFSQTVLPNSITESIVIIDSNQYYQLDIKHPNNFVETTDFITISNSETIGEIPKTSINAIHQVYKINKTDQTYSIILLPFNKITNVSAQKGGSSLKIKTTAKVRFLFNKPNTLGEILGFSNPGDVYSVTPFSSVISNNDSYIYQNDLDTVGNKSSISNILQFTGKSNYWLLYLNNFESVILNNGLESCFAKILLAGTQGDIIYNSFVNSPIEFDVPIPTVSELNIKITDSKGNIINFENTNFSFTIRIYELISKPKGTAKFSNDSSFHKEMIEKIGLAEK